MALPEIMSEMSVENIVRVYRQATDSQVARGLAWYQDAHTIALALDPSNVARAAGILAAISPRLDWDKNVTYAAATFTDGFCSRVLPDSARKADRILAGEAPLDVLGGNKVRAFYGAILDPSSDSVVIDRHAFDVALGRVTNDAARGALGRKGAYEYVADLYRQAAEIIGVSAVALQAITWTVWRETSSAFAAANVRALGDAS